MPFIIFGKTNIARHGTSNARQIVQKKLSASLKILLMERIVQIQSTDLPLIDGLFRIFIMYSTMR